MRIRSNDPIAIAARRQRTVNKGTLILLAHKFGKESVGTYFPDPLIGSP